MKASTSFLLVLCGWLTGAVLADAASLSVRIGDLQARLAETEGQARIPILQELVSINRTEPIREARAYAAEALQLLDAHPDPQVELDVRLDLSWALSVEGEAALAIVEAQRGLTLAKAQSDSARTAEGYYLLGLGYWYASDTELAIEHAQRALALQTKRQLRRDAGSTHTLLGAIRRGRSEYEAAIDHHMQARRIGEQLDDPSGIARARNNLALVFRDLDQFEQALDHFQAAADHYRSLERAGKLATTLNNVGLTLIELGRVSEALPVLKEALGIHERQERPHARAKVLSNLAFAHERLRDDDQALVYHNQALALREALQDQRGLARTLATMGSLFERREKYDLAETHFARALAAAETADARSEQSLILNMQSRLFEEQGRYDEALHAHRAHKQVADQLDEDRAALRVARLEAANQIALRELELSRQRTRSAVLSSASTLLAAIVIGLAVYARSRSQAVKALRDGHRKLQQATEQIQESEQRYRSLFFDEVVPKFLVDVETNRLVDANRPAARLCNVGVGELRDMPVESLEPVWLKKAARHCGALRGHETLTADFADLGGVERQAEVRLLPVALRGRPSVVVTVHDITEERRLEAERIRVDKLESLGQLAGGIAHDFNNALAGILGYLGLARVQVDAPLRVAPLLQEAEQAVKETVHLTRQLLAFSHGGAPVREVADIGALVQSTARFATSGASVGLEMRVDDDLWASSVDTGQVKQVISNLVLNAVQALDGMGTVIVSVRNYTAVESFGPTAGPGPYVRIEVVDDGPGIPFEIQSKVMDPYFTTKSDGSGLGLATTFAIVSRHQGWLDFTSQVGHGTAFRVYLPALPDAELAASETVGAEVPRGMGRVLVMDDEAALRSVYRGFLEQMGYRVESACDGREAIAMFTAALGDDPFDVVVMDLTVPGGMGGQAAMEAVRRLDPDVPGIVASGYSNDPVMSCYEQYGFTASLTKPFEMADVARVVRSVLDRAH